MNKTIYPEYLQDIRGLQDVPTKGALRFYITSTYMRSIPLQHHDYVEFTYFEKATGIQSINGIRHEIKSGTVSFILPQQMHFIECPTDPLSLKYCCMFDLRLLFGTHDDSELYRLLYGVGTSTPSFVDFEGQEKEKMHRLFQELLEEYRQPNSPGNFHMIRAKLTEMLLLFIRAGSHTSNAGLPKENKLNWFWQLLHDVHSRYTEPLTLEDLARKFYVSSAHLSRTFKEQTGQSFLEYLHRIRIESACTLLQHTNLPVSEIGHTVGFESLRSFSRVFREMKGMTAKQYRKKPPSA